MKITKEKRLAGDTSRICDATSEIERLFPNGRLDRVLLVAPPDTDVSMFNYETAKRGRYWNFPPYGLGIIASHLRADGVMAEILNLNHQVLRACRLSTSNKNFDFDSVWSEALRDKIETFQPGVIGVTCMFTQTHRSTVSVCNMIRGLFENIPIALNCLRWGSYY